MEKCYETYAEIYMALLQIRSTLTIPLLPNPATLLFSSPLRRILPRCNRQSLLCDNDESNANVLIDDPNQVNI